MTKEQIEKATKEFVDKGLLVEAGWIGFQIATIDPKASEAQLKDQRATFFAGAMHVFSSMMEMMSEDREPTEEDYARMTKLAKELELFGEMFMLEHGFAVGGKH